MLRQIAHLLVTPAFGQGKFVRVYGRQGKHGNCTRNLYGFGKQKAALICLDVI
jgi:hypothetical protein